jgi:hypothetical protein
VRILACSIALVLSLLSLLHLYWAVGGKLGVAGAVPEVNGAPTMTPGPLACLVVALLLAIAGLLIVARAGLLSLPVPGWMVRFGSWGVGLVFLVRAIGDFNTAGLFRRVTGTRFARNDARIYTPLCLVLATGCIIVALEG